MPKQPHIVIFNPDSWRGDVLGFAGDAAVRTPVLDHLVASEATGFTAAYCQNPICTPSRCSFMTGWYPHVRGHRTQQHMLHREHGEPMLLDVLRREGWRVFWGGKNDLVPGQLPRRDFADVLGEPGRHNLDPRLHGELYEQARGTPAGDSYYSFLSGTVRPRPGERFYRDTDQANVEDAIACIDGHDPAQPLCVFLPLEFPHPPYGVEEEFLAGVDRSLLPPRIADAIWDGKPSVITAARERFGLHGWSEPRWNELRAVYRGMCARVDAQLGLVIDALRQRGMWEDTLLCVFSDHGDFTGDYDVVVKTQNTFEECLVRVPLVMRLPSWAGGRPGTNPALTELIDVSETIYDLCGIDPGYDRFGRSLLPLLRGEAAEHRDAVFCEGGRLRGEPQAVQGLAGQGERNWYWPLLSLEDDATGDWQGKAAMCRTVDWKYVRRLYERDELYDLATDPGERVNRIADPACAGIRAELQDRLLRWYQETSDVVPRAVDRR